MVVSSLWLQGNPSISSLPPSLTQVLEGLFLSLFFFSLSSLCLCVLLFPSHFSLSCHHHCGCGAGQCPLSCHLHTGTQCSLIGENAKDWPRIQVKVDFVTLD